MELHNQTSKIKKSDAVNLSQALSKPQPVYFSGYLDGPQTLGTAYSSSAGSSFFTWDYGSPGRIINFMKLIGLGGNIIFPTDKQEQTLQGLFSAMPSWPASGSVEAHNGVVLVKLNGTLSSDERP